jgi:branched-chain amino acid transport system ATP-binding protein
MLELREVSVSYGMIEALKGVSLRVERGEIVALIGANGAGKSTTLMSVSGVAAVRSGSILYDGEELSGRPAHSIVRAGISQVPEGRRIFARMTVRENLEMGAFTINQPAEVRNRMENVFGLFPRLKERAEQKGGTLSGGEQQMLATGRGLMLKPKILLMDEPSMGLAPVLVDAIFDVIAQLNKDGTTILLVEQNALMALRTAARAYVLETGRIVLAGSAQEVAQNPEVKRAYLGG